MQLIHQCPACGNQNRSQVDQTTEHIQCSHCEWSRPIGSVDLTDEKPEKCVACGCDDLWRQKDFPPQIGLPIVGLGALLSTWAWADRRPVWAIGILMGFALFDLILYALMKDVLVCYRCGARHRHMTVGEAHPRFHLEKAERYRQEEMRLEKSKSVITKPASGGR